MQIAVCDDDKMCLLELKERLSAMQSVEHVYPFSDLKTFLLSVENGSCYDAVFMDIDWGQDSTGIDAAEELYKLHPEAKIIYVTGHSEYNQHIFLQRSNLSGFLTKPVDNDWLKATLKKVADAIHFSEQPLITLRQSGGTVSVPCREIYFIESKGRTIEAHTADKIIVSYGQIENIAKSLPAWFIQCHKSYVVNMRQIQRFQPGEILLKNGTLIPASRSKYSKTKEAYFDFIGETF
jgi:DNA-binding LytR/AlgR family response regulator